MDIGKVPAGEKIIELNLSDLKAGVYVYTIDSDQGSISKTMIIE